MRAIRQKTRQSKWTCNSGSYALIQQPQQWLYKNDENEQKNTHTQNTHKQQWEQRRVRTFAQVHKIQSNIHRTQNSCNLYLILSLHYKQLASICMHSVDGNDLARAKISWAWMYCANLICMSSLFTPFHYYFKHSPSTENNNNNGMDERAGARELPLGTAVRVRISESR